MIGWVKVRQSPTHSAIGPKAGSTAGLLGQVGTYELARIPQRLRFQPEFLMLELKSPHLRMHSYPQKSLPIMSPLPQNQNHGSGNSKAPHKLCKNPMDSFSTAEVTALLNVHIYVWNVLISLIRCGIH